MKQVNRCFLFVLVVLFVAKTVKSFNKVVVPSVYKDWLNGQPDWVTNSAIQEKYNFSTFIYQKLNSSEPNYISTNRGTEGGVYLRYIVDHYDSFPDVAVFVHAFPGKHATNWLDRVGAISPNASYSSINDLYNYYCAELATSVKNYEPFFMEQCYRDILQTVHEMRNDSAAFNKLYPNTKNMVGCNVICQQFLLSRETMRRRPLATWKHLLFILGQQNVCHAGEPDYAALTYYQKYKIKDGPEDPDLIYRHSKQGDRNFPKGEGYGALTQGTTSEHISHVIFGHENLQMPKPDNAYLCRQFLPDTPNSPCLSPEALRKMKSEVKQEKTSDQLQREQQENANRQQQHQRNIDREESARVTRLKKRREDEANQNTLRKQSEERRAQRENEQKQKELQQVQQTQRQSPPRQVPPSPPLLPPPQPTAAAVAVQLSVPNGAAVPQQDRLRGSVTRPQPQPQTNRGHLVVDGKTSAAVQQQSPNPQSVAESVRNSAFTALPPRSVASPVVATRSQVHKNLPAQVYHTHNEHDEMVQRIKMDVKSRTQQAHAQQGKSVVRGSGMQRDSSNGQFRTESTPTLSQREVDRKNRPGLRRPINQQ